MSSYYLIRCQTDSGRKTEYDRVIVEFQDVLTLVQVFLSP